MPDATVAADAVVLPAASVGALVVLVEPQAASAATGSALPRSTSNDRRERPEMEAMRTPFPCISTTHTAKLTTIQHDEPEDSRTTSVYERSYLVKRYARQEEDEREQWAKTGRPMTRGVLPPSG